MVSLNVPHAWNGGANLMAMGGGVNEEDLGVAEALKEIEGFLMGWKPYAELPGDIMLQAQILAFLAAPEREERRRHLSAASSLFTLHERYRELEIFRSGRNERAERFEELLALDASQLAAAIREKRQKDLLGLIQFCFEFGRHPAQPKQLLMRDFLLTVFAMEVGAVPIKYSAYGGGVLYSGGGKTHDEMARDFVRYGLGGGVPQAGGLFYRPEPLRFVYDVSSTAFRSGDPGQVREGFLQGLRNTGGDLDKVSISLDTTRMNA